MITMVDKVAQAIADNINAALPPGVEIDAHYAARAAIEAMREPTAIMREAVRDAGGIHALAYGNAAWPTMIQAALKEEGQ